VPDVEVTFLAAEKLPDVIRVRRVETVLLRDGVTNAPCLAVVSSKAGDKAPSDDELEKYFTSAGYSKDAATGLFTKQSFDLADKDEFSVRC